MTPFSIPLRRNLHVIPKMVSMICLSNIPHSVVTAGKERKKESRYSLYSIRKASCYKSARERARAFINGVVTLKDDYLPTFWQGQEGPLKGSHRTGSHLFSLWFSCTTWLASSLFVLSCENITVIGVLHCRRKKIV